MKHLHRVNISPSTESPNRDFDVGALLPNAKRNDEEAPEAAAWFSLLSAERIEAFCLILSEKGRHSTGSVIKDEKDKRLL